MSDLEKEKETVAKLDLMEEEIKSIQAKPVDHDFLYDFFICHSGDENKNEAMKLYFLLSMFGFKVFVDKPELPLTSDFVNDLCRAVADCRVFMPIVGVGFYNANWCKAEANRAIKINKINPNCARMLPFFRVSKPIPCNFKGGISEDLSNILKPTSGKAGVDPINIDEAIRVLAADSFGLIAKHYPVYYNQTMASSNIKLNHRTPNNDELCQLQTIIFNHSRNINASNFSIEFCSQELQKMKNDAKNSKPSASSTASSINITGGDKGTTALYNIRVKAPTSELEATSSTAKFNSAVNSVSNVFTGANVKITGSSGDTFGVNMSI